MDRLHRLDRVATFARDGDERLVADLATNLAWSVESVQVTLCSVFDKDDTCHRKIECVLPADGTAVKPIRLQAILLGERDL
ncbi:hypothetical protein ZWY2020_005993 [Hordeum vulgare]|nr:hypothetical protein ZWY2020_005993 [Hordeum vulgare]